MERQPNGGLNEQPGREAWPVAWPGDLAYDSAGQVQPRHQITQQRAGRLACGELVMEPALGPVRVASVIAVGTRLGSRRRRLGRRSRLRVARLGAIRRTARSWYAHRTSMTYGLCAGA
jgi:hypothetical protein